jgi:2'-5' RNA ligase
MVRTFIALVIPDAWKEFLGRVEGDLAARMTGLSWVKPSNMHITVRFLGDLGEDGVRRAGEAARRGSEGRAVFRAGLGPLGAFPSLRRPRVLWTGLSEGADDAIALARDVNRSLERSGFGPSDKPFKPHITLARVREHAQGLEAFERYVSPAAPGPAMFDRIVVMKSDLHPAGARYTALEEIRLHTPGT